MRTTAVPDKTLQIAKIQTRIDGICYFAIGLYTGMVIGLPNR